MPRGLNKVTIIGNLCCAPEMRYSPSGQAVTTFSVACSRTYTAADGGRHEVTEWFHVVAWRRLAEICARRLARGSRVYVEGRLQTRSWDDGEGRRQQRVEIVAYEMIVLDDDRRDDDLSGHETEPRPGPVEEGFEDLDQHNYEEP